MSKRKTTEQFKKEALSIHNNKYEYDLVEYVTARNKVKIRCMEHGIFEQNPIDHIKGRGCPKCANNIKQTFSEFVEKAKIIHNNKYLNDYPLI